MLTDRKQFTQVDCFDSFLLKSPNCSVLQGSKLASLFYTLYINELPLLNNLMFSTLFTKLTKQLTLNIDNIDHTTVNFVDDSTNVISGKNVNDLMTYTTKFYTLLTCFYTINKLKINDEKTHLMVSCKNKLREFTKDMYFMAGDFKIQQSQCIKMLGHFYSLTFCLTPM